MLVGVTYTIEKENEIHKVLKRRCFKSVACSQAIGICRKCEIRNKEL